MAQEKINALVLRYADFSESSRMLTLFFMEHGKISVSARGCRRPKSALRAVSELYTLSEMIVSSRGSSYILSSGTLIDSFYDLRLDYDRLNTAQLLCDLTSTVLREEEPQPRLFGLLARCLGLLSHEKLSPSLVAMYYSLHILRLEGFLPEIEHCVFCGRELGTHPWFSVREGGALCSECSLTAPDARRVAAGLLSTMRFILTLKPDQLGVFHMTAAVEEALTDLLQEILFSRLDRRFTLR